MCDPVTLFGTTAAASSGAALGVTGALAGTGIAAGAVSTTGLIGVGGSFAIGSGSIAGFLSSPIFSIGTQLIGFGVQMAGQSTASGIAQQQADYRNAILQNNKIAADQDIETEKQQEKLRQQLLSEEGNQRRGDIRVAQAALGQLVDVGSAGDITAELASEVAFKKLVSGRESDLRVRNINIQASNLTGEQGINTLKATEAQTASRFTQAGTILTTASTLTRKFRFGKGGLAFRTA